jgi:Concanavalin A-like lectin/glucanases superfamily
MKKSLRRTVTLLLPALLIVSIAAGPAQASTPAAIWHMDELTGGVMFDASGNNNDGTLVGTVAQGQLVSWSGTSYSFQGGPALVDVPDDPTLDPGTAPITLTVHANFTTPPATDYDLIRKGLSTTAGGDYKMEIVVVNGQARVLCLFRGSAKVQKQSSSKTPVLTNGSWHTLQCVKTDSSVEVFVDGKSYGKKTGTTGSIANSDHLLIGAKTTTGGDQYEGLMDEVQIDVG